MTANLQKLTKALREGSIEEVVESQRDKILQALEQKLPYELKISNGRTIYITAEDADKV